MAAIYQVLVLGAGSVAGKYKFILFLQSLCIYRHYHRKGLGVVRGGKEMIDINLPILQSECCSEGIIKKLEALQALAGGSGHCL